MILIIKEKGKLKVALAIPTQAPIMLEKEILDSSLVADKAIKALSKYDKRQENIYLVFYLFFLFLKFLQ